MSMFHRISRRIALQFTGFVLLLLLINGAIFLAADIGNVRRMTHARLARSAQIVALQTPLLVSLPPRLLPPHLRDRVRLIDAHGVELYTGSLFEDVPFAGVEGFSEITVGDDTLDVITVGIIRDDATVGFVQVADTDRQRIGELPLRALLYLAVSLAISVLTFAVGILFARRSLQPAEETMQRLEQFTQDASHELRTPLAALNSSLDLALKTERFREGILSAKDDVRRIAALIERLLALARLDRFGMTPSRIDLSRLTEELAEQYRALAAEHGLTLTRDIAPGIHVDGDPDLVRQAMANLIGNAIKFNKPKGSVRLRLTSEALEVEDTGIGILPGDLLKIFDRFYQVDGARSDGGFGLGLALAKRIIDLHGWSIDARSKHGSGTTFTVYFRKA